MTFSVPTGAHVSISQLQQTSTTSVIGIEWQVAGA